MNKNAKNMLRDSLLPVILGDNLRAHLLAARIYFTFGIVSYICDAKKSPLSLFDPFSRYFPLFSDSNADIALKSLSYAASSLDYLPLLIPCSEKLGFIVDDNRDFLESRFIISDSSSLFSSSVLSKLL